MIPWELLDTAATTDGTEMSLHRRGQEYSIRVDRQELMNSRQHGSEEAMARLACGGLTSERPRILIGGLGMGFTLAAANACLPAGARIEVAELMPAVIRWNQGPLGDLAGHPLSDPRVQVHQGDIRGLLEGVEATWDVILLDVDNGPDGLTQESNRWLYGRKGLARLARALRPGGVLSVWSASPDRPFTQRLGATGFRSQTHTVRARPNGRGPRHTVWVATRR